MLIYRILVAMTLPFLVVWILLRRVLGVDPARSLAERLGHVPARAAGPSLWVHGASVGEVTSLRPLLAALFAAEPRLQILLTTNTATARAMVQGWQMPGLQAAFAPIESKAAINRLLRLWQPKAMIGVESELWPLRIRAIFEAGIPIVLVGARLSSRSANRWRVAKAIIAGSMGRMAFVSAQDSASQARLISLGLDPAVLGPIVDLKAFDNRMARLAPFTAHGTRATTLLAASTHAGEEAGILDAFLEARAQGRFSRLILAPRHPRRSAEIARMIRYRKLSFVSRSSGKIPTRETDVLLADTIGEMDHWYAMAGTCVIGGTFAPKGGHTPWEPVRAGCAIVHGPSVANFADQFARLDAAGAAVAVANLAGISTALLDLKAERQSELATTALSIQSTHLDFDALLVAIRRLAKIQSAGPDL